LEYIGHVGWRALMALMALMADDVTCCDISLPYQVFGLLVMQSPSDFYLAVFHF